MKYEIKSRIWIEANGQTLLGQGRVQLLEAIDKQGSLSSAAKSIGMSYKKAWRLLDEMNKTASTPLVITAVGGKDGGGTQLTKEGQAMVTAFKSIKKESDELLKTIKDKLPKS